MPRQNTSTSRKGFGIFLGSLRDSRGEKQQAFAVQLGVARSTLAMVESGERRPSNDLLIELERMFSEDKQKIQAEAIHHKLSFSPVDTEWLRIQREIDKQIASGETQEALFRVISLILAKGNSTRQLYWLYLRCWDIATLENRQPLSNNTIDLILLLAKYLRVAKSQRVSLHDRGACYALANKEPLVADHILNVGLADFPNAAQLWYRKAVLKWTVGDLTTAYSMLLSALKHKPTSRSDILGLRGRILTSWGHHQEGYKDLVDALADPDEPPTESAPIRGALLFNECIRGEITQSGMLTEFRQLERTLPGNAWLAYYRACCLIRLGGVDRGFSELEKRALIFDKPEIYKWLIDKIKGSVEEHRIMPRTVGRDPGYVILKINERGSWE